MSADQSFSSTGGRRRPARRTPLTIAIAGNVGTGKTSLVDALAGVRVSDRTRRTRETTVFSAGKNNELKITQHPIETTGNDMHPTLLDVHNFGMFTDCGPDIDRLTQYLEDKFDEMVAEQSRIRRNPRFIDRRVHACLYLIDCPHGLREIDVTAMTRLSTLTNVIPVVSRAESLSQDELRSMKRKIREDCKHYKIPTYEFDKEIGLELPLHITRTNEYDEQGNALLSLKLPYGRVDATDPAVSDFVALKAAIFDTYAYDIIDQTVDILYEQYRTIRLSDANARYSVLEPEVLAGHASRLKQERLERESRELKEQEELIQRELEDRRKQILEREQELRKLEERLAAEREAIAQRTLEAEEKARNSTTSQTAQSDSVAGVAYDSDQTSVPSSSISSSAVNSTSSHNNYNEIREMSSPFSTRPLESVTENDADVPEGHDHSTNTNAAVTSTAGSGGTTGIAGLSAGTHTSYASLNSSDYGDDEFISVRPITTGGSFAKPPPPPMPMAPPQEPPKVPSEYHNNVNNGTSPASSSAKTGPVIRAIPPTRSGSGNDTEKAGFSVSKSPKAASPVHEPPKPPGSPSVTSNSPKSSRGFGSPRLSSSPVGNAKAASTTNSHKGKISVASIGAAATAAAQSVSSRLKPKQSLPQVNQQPPNPESNSPSLSHQRSFVASPKVRDSPSFASLKAAATEVQRNGEFTTLVPPRMRESSSYASLKGASGELPSRNGSDSTYQSPKMRDSPSYHSLKGSPSLGSIRGASEHPTKNAESVADGENKPSESVDDNGDKRYSFISSETAPLVPLDTMPGAFPGKPSRSSVVIRKASLSSLSAASGDGSPGASGWPNSSHSNRSESSVGSEVDRGASSPSLPARSPNRPASFVSLNNTLVRSRSQSEKHTNGNGNNAKSYAPSVPKIPASPK